MRVKKLVSLTEAQVRWLREKSISLSKYVQEKINQDIEKELLEKPRIYNPEDGRTT